MKREKLFLALLFCIAATLTIACNSSTSASKTVSGGNSTSNTAPSPSPAVSASPVLSKQEIEQKSAEVHSALKEWREAAESIALRTNDPEARFYLQAIRNAGYAIPVDENGQPAYIPVRPVPSPNSPWVAVTVIEEGKVLPVSWRNLLNHNQYIANFLLDGSNTVVMRSDMPAPKVLRGLVLLHEMRHWKQYNLGGMPPGTPNAAQLREIDAYNYEFALMDKLQLSQYETIVAQEVSRIRRGFQTEQTFGPDSKNPNLDVLFPGANSSEYNRKVAATELMLRATFELADELTPEVALMKKVAVMQAIGYK